MGSVPRSGRSPGAGHGNPLQVSCLENAMDTRAWQAMIHKVTKPTTAQHAHTTHRLQSLLLVAYPSLQCFNISSSGKILFQYINDKSSHDSIVTLGDEILFDGQNPTRMKVRIKKKKNVFITNKKRRKKTHSGDESHQIGQYILSKSN